MRRISKRTACFILSLMLMLSAFCIPAGAAAASEPLEAGNADIDVVKLIDDIYYIYQGEKNVVMLPQPYIEFSLKNGSYVNEVTIELKTENTENGWLTLCSCRDMGSSYGYLFVGSADEYPIGLFAETSVDGPGMYNNLLRFCVSYGNGKQYCSDEFRVHWMEDQKSFDRLYGNNRYDTALAIAEELRKTEPDGVFANAVIACGTDFADALGGTYLAVKSGAPIFLVNKAPQVMQKAAAEIADNMRAGGTVFILGGTGAVPAEMEDILASNGINYGRIVRFAGRNRYDTNLKVLEYCGVSGDDEIMICSGTSFADALSASAAGLPIVLVGGSFTGDQKLFLSNLTESGTGTPPKWYIIGGPGAVSYTAANEIMSIRQMTPGYTRIEGANRYETSRNVANTFFAESMGGMTYCTSYHMLLAYGKDFPDGLAGGVLAHKLGAPLILVDNNHWVLAGAYEVFYSPLHIYALGGSALISDTTVNKILYCTYEDLMF